MIEVAAAGFTAGLIGGVILAFGAALLRRLMSPRSR